MFHSGKARSRIAADGASTCDKLTNYVEIGVYRDLEGVAHTAKLIDHFCSPPVADAKHVLNLLVLTHVGTDLHELLDERPVTYFMWEDMLRSVSMALQQVHRAGRVHGDIKLENITYSDQAGWFLIDFGFGYTTNTVRGMNFAGTYPNVLPHYGLAKAGITIDKLGTGQHEATESSTTTIRDIF